MGQKVNPHGIRVGVIKNWDSRWFEKDETFGDTLVSDYNIREFLMNYPIASANPKEESTLKDAGIPKIEIERDSARVRIFIHCAKPGVLIGRGGVMINKLKAELEKMLGKSVALNVVEVRQPDLNAQLVAENIAGQLERRVSFRRAMKLCIGRTMRLGAKGIKVNLSGRLAGAEIARTEHYHEGTIPLQTLRADIEYGFAEANTTYGKIGVKVWIFKGEVLPDVKKKFTISKPADLNPPKQDRRDRKPGDRRFNGDRKPQGDRKFNNGDRKYGNNNNNANGQRGGYRPVNRNQNNNAEGGNK